MSAAAIAAMAAATSAATIKMPLRSCGIVVDDPFLVVVIKLCVVAAIAGAIIGAIKLLDEGLWTSCLGLMLGLACGPALVLAASLLWQGIIFLFTA